MVFYKYFEGTQNVEMLGGSVLHLGERLLWFVSCLEFASLIGQSFLLLKEVPCLLSFIDSNFRLSTPVFHAAALEFSFEGASLYLESYCGQITTVGAPDVGLSRLC